MYFWWSGCGPCRAFHQSVTDEHLELLESNGIQLVSVNFDQTKEVWKVASAKDNIRWTNLYSGEKSDLFYAYDVQYFPTKILFNQDKEHIPFNWKDINDLIQLKSKP